MLLSVSAGVRARTLRDCQNSPPTVPRFFGEYVAAMDVQAVAFREGCQKSILLHPPFYYENNQAHMGQDFRLPRGTLLGT
jgi:hypothetical protein